jgi:ferrochelatase
VLSHGAAERLDDVDAYYAHILHGRPVRPERLEALKARYRAIGGGSPLNRITRAQAAGITAALRAAGFPVRPYVGFQHTPPFIEEAAGEMLKDGIQEAIVLVMTAFYSPRGVGGYLERVNRATNGWVQLRPIRQWHDTPEFLALLEGRLRQALDDIAQRGTGPCHVVFTAHSLPIVPDNRDDPYTEQFRATARALAERIGIERWSTCYQSASANGRPWLGPDILDELEGVRASGAQQVVICPSSFAADNLEVLYDIGIEAICRAQDLGMAVAQTAPLNEDPELLGLLARLAARRLNE